MKKTLTFLISAIALCGCNAVEGNFSIVPNPVSIQYKGCGIRLTDSLVFKADSCLNTICSTFGQTIENDPISHFPVIKLKIDPSLEKEGYILDCRWGKAVIKGGSEQGLWWGLQTLRQILAQCDNFIPGLVIEDRPQFTYRGAHLDCCRHFFSTAEVKEFIDIIALHKINTLHWHLTDDQGWRIEIKKYPLLTEVGSQRAETLVGHYWSSNVFDHTPYGGYYTQDELKDIVDYASKRYITIIPEVEMPGHAVAALASYPEYGCTGGPYQVYRNWGVSDDVFCVGKDGTIKFLEDILDEVCAIFPSEYIHIGGDEAPRTRWENCPDCQAKMHSLGLTSEAQLQSYLVNTIEKYLNAKGRKVIGWDEILEGGVSKTATIMSWRGAKGGIEAAKMGNDAIMTPNTYCYLDYYQTADPQANGEPLGIGGHLPLSECYAFDPFDQLDDEQKTHIKGVQANLWTEYIASFSHLQQMALPRLAALAEVSWSCANRTAYKEFVERMRASLLPIYNSCGYKYSDFAFRNPPVE